MKDTYNRIVEDWHKDHQEDTWWVEGTNTFVSFLKTGDTVLDAGCGAGTKTKYLLEKGLKALGIDFSEGMINIARQEVPKGKFLVMDMREVETLDREFDGIFLQAVLLHIPKKEVRDVLRRLVGKLKQGGYFYLAVKEKKPDGGEEEVKVEEGYGYSYERFFSYFKLEELQQHFTELGLKVVWESVVSSNNTRWIQIIGQKI